MSMFMNWNTNKGIHIYHLKSKKPYYVDVYRVEYDVMFRVLTFCFLTVMFSVGAFLSC